MKYSFFVFVSLLLSSMMQFTSEKPSALAKLLQRAEDSNILFSDEPVYCLMREKAAGFIEMQKDLDEARKNDPNFQRYDNDAEFQEALKKFEQQKKDLARVIALLNANPAVLKASLAANNVKRHNHDGCIIL